MLFGMQFAFLGKRLEGGICFIILNYRYEQF